MFGITTLQGGLCQGFPDTCKTPTPAGPVPIPYPNIAMCNQANPGTCSTKITIVGQPVTARTPTSPPVSRSRRPRPRSSSPDELRRESARRPRHPLPVRRRGARRLHPPHAPRASPPQLPPVGRQAAPREPSARPRRSRQRHQPHPHRRRPSRPRGHRHQHGRARCTARAERSNVDTPLSHFVEQRRGVCQDFTHFTLACLRSLGLTARYVSGYLAAPDTGTRAHAWLALWLGDDSWIDLDPTFNRLGPLGHITLAVGRDYDDVALSAATSTTTAAAA